MSLDEIKVWIGPGAHTLYFQLGTVKSNDLAITVPEQGRIHYDLEYKPAESK